MLYVPIIPPHVDPPSPRTRELADLLVRAIDEYEKYHPSVTGAEVRAALRMAGQKSGGGGRLDRRAAAVAAGAAVLGALFFGVALSRDTAGTEAVPMVAVSVAVFVLLLLVFVLKRMGDH